MEKDLYESEAGFGDLGLKIMNAEAVREFPHNCVGVIKVNTNDKYLVGTGFLLASDIVLTVAHNVYSRLEKREYAGLCFYPGVSWEHDPAEGYRVIDMRFPKEFISAEESEKTKYDYALLKLDGHVQGAQFIELGVNYVLRQEEYIGIIGYRYSNCLDTAYQMCMWKPNTHSI